MNNMKMGTLMYIMLLFGLYLTNFMTVVLIAIDTAPLKLDVTPILEILILGIAFPPLGILLGATEIGYAIQIF